MNVRRALVALCLVSLVTAGGLIAAEKEFKATCPVSGKPAKETSVVDLPKERGKVYFCCDNCPKAYAANPKKFALKVNAQLVETDQLVQVACPITGKPVNKEVAVEANGAEVGLCCKGCLGKVEKADDDGKAKLLFSNAALKKGFTNQTLCPVSGKPINPEAKVEYKGKNVYFCCPGCPPAFEKDPDKFLAKLPQFKKAQN
jgi:YHS domain-containing protein